MTGSPPPVSGGESAIMASSPLLARTFGSYVRVASLLGSFLVALSAGSNYAFSSFAPQLQDSAHLTSTQINVVGLAGNAGVYLSGPLWGKWVDRRGPKSALVIGAVLVLCGYWGLSHSYQSPPPVVAAAHSPARAPAASRAPLPFPVIVVLNLLTGLGNSGAFTAAMNAQAKSWGGNRRGSATALVLSGFGLSAFVYSSLSHVLFPGNTQDYLLLLALGSSVSFIVGFIVIQILPPADPESAEGDGAATPVRPRRPSSTVSYSRSRTSSDLSALAFARSQSIAQYGDGEDTRASADAERAAPAAYGEREDVEAGADQARDLLDEEGGRSGGRGRWRRSLAGTAKHSGGNGASNGIGEDVTGLDLLKHVDFYILFLLMTCISGAGLLLINNVGTITRTLWRHNRAHGTPNGQDETDGWLLARTAVEDVFATTFKKDEATAVQQYQAHQVSAISIGNALGRILIGLLADLTVNLTGDSRLRVWMLLGPCALALLSQSLAAAPNTVTSLRMLLVVSGSTGLMYGTLFGICPSLNLEFFGLKNFSQNWGYVSLSPVVAGNIFNLLFGRIYDAHVPAGSHTHECPDGEECYRQVFVITTWCAVAATLLTSLLIYRRAGAPQWIARLNRSSR